VPQVSGLSLQRSVSGHKGGTADPLGVRRYSWGFFAPVMMSVLPTYWSVMSTMWVAVAGVSSVVPLVACASFCSRTALHNASRNDNDVDRSISEL
jgi:hypothetical protein